MAILTLSQDSAGEEKKRCYKRPGILISATPPLLLIENVERTLTPSNSYVLSSDELFS